MTNKPYIQHNGKVIKTDSQFAALMAIALNPKSQYKNGIIRCITSRSGDVAKTGTTDTSELHLITGTSLKHFKIGKKLNIKNESAIIQPLIAKGMKFIGLEDPDIWIDDKTGLIHVYFTIPIQPIRKSAKKNKKVKIHLGHAVGKDLNSLQMTPPVLMDTNNFSAKELSVAPLNSKGFRFNLIESRDRLSDITYSTVMTVISQDMAKPWQYANTVFHPAKNNIPWIGGHASPGPLFPKTFIDPGKGKLVGIINGRQADKIVNGQAFHGLFSIGLFVYDYEHGRIDWVSPQPFIQDSQAKAISFASQFIQTGKGKGLLYAHVDDSFVRAYTLNAVSIKKLLPLNTHKS